MTAPASITGQAHNFGANDAMQRISLPPGSYTIVLQWEEEAPATTDMDIFLINTTGSQLLGFNRNNIGGEAIEVLPFIIQGQTVESNILITKSAGSNVRFKYIIFRGQAQIMEYVSGTSTVVGQANANGAMSVGAVLYSNTPAYGVAVPTIASFSSVGGTRITGETGLRQKPDFSGPNGVNTTVDMGGQNIDGDGYPNFFGTSASAPHAAAAAALVIEARKEIPA
jgi:subtilisin family serine protease